MGRLNITEQDIKYLKMVLQKRENQLLESLGKLRNLGIPENQLTGILEEYQKAGDMIKKLIR